MEEDASMLEDSPKPEGGQSSSLMDPVMEKPSYIQEISSLIAESSAGELSK